MEKTHFCHLHLKMSNCPPSGVQSSEIQGKLKSKWKSKSGKLLVKNKRVRFYDIVKMRNALFFGWYTSVNSKKGAFFFQYSKTKFQ